MITLDRNAKFSDMSDSQLQAWRRWADNHDWGQSQPAYFYRDMNETLYLVTECAVHSDSVGWTTEKQYSQTPKEMRDWAGY